MINVVILSVSDYRMLPNGGEVMLLHNFLEANNSTDICYHLVGMTFSESEHVGKWSKIRVGGKEYSFLPVAMVLKDKERTHIPFRLRVTCGIYKYLDIIDSVKPDVYYIHAPELMIPIWRKQNAHVVFHVHGDPCQTLRISRFPLFRMEFFSKLYWRIIEKTMRLSEKIIWAADRSRELYLGQQPHMVEEVVYKSTTIHSSFDPKMIPEFNLLPPLSNRKHLVTVGRLSAVKRIDFIIKVLDELVKRGNDVDLLICGDGEEMPALRQLAGKLGLSKRILFLGLTNRQATAAALASADAFLFASKNEAMSLVVLESLYMGTPVISTDVGDIPYVVKKGETGYIINHLNLTIFAECVENVLTTGKDYYFNKCRNIALQYTPENMSNAIDKCIISM